MWRFRHDALQAMTGTHGIVRSLVIRTESVHGLLLHTVHYRIQYSAIRKFEFAGTIRHIDWEIFNNTTPNIFNYLSVWRNNPEALNLLQHSCENRNPHNCCKPHRLFTAQCYYLAGCYIYR